MKKYKVIVVMLFVCFVSFAQNEIKSEGEKPNTVEEQFDYLIKKSNNYQNYKVIKKVHLYRLKSNILDSLKSAGTSILKSKNTIEKQKSDISSLNLKLADIEKKLNETTNSKESIKFLGLVEVNKSIYRAFMWSSIIGLLGYLFFLTFRFKQNNIITKKSKKELLENQKELEAFKKKTLENEQKMRRKLQDEINKNKYGSK